MSLARERFDITVEYGEAGEQAMLDVLGLGRHDLEVKRPTYDDQMFFIEVSKLSHGEWVPSGIEVTEAEWWALTGPTLAWAFLVRTEQLRVAVARARHRGLRLDHNHRTTTQETKGYLLPIVRIIEAGQPDAATRSSWATSADGPR